MVDQLVHPWRQTFIFAIPGTEQAHRRMLAPRSSVELERNCGSEVVGRSQSDFGRLEK